MRGLRLKVAVLAIVAGTLVATPTALGGDEEALFQGRYHSISVTKDGEPHEVAKGTKLRAAFGHGEEADGVAWESGCNTFWAEMTIEKDVMDVRLLDYTLVGCRRRLHRQDAFFQRFFESDPAWSASGRDLALSNDRVTIELRRRLPG